MKVDTATVYIVSCGDCGRTREATTERAIAIVSAVSAGWHELADGTPICRRCWAPYAAALQREEQRS